MVKRLLAVTTGVTMLGATAMGAMAASLDNYPNDFVTDGVFDGYFVVGENAATVDNLAMTDIAAGMRYMAAGGASTVTVEGDAWMVGTSAKFLEMADTDATSVSDQPGETFYNISTFIGDEELGGLVDGTWSTNENDYNFQQFLFFDDTSNDHTIVKYSENDDDVTADHLYFENGKQIGRYKLEFTSTAQSDITDANGAADTTGAYLDDFEDTTLDMFGKSYSVVQARRPTAASGGGAKLILMAGATADTLLEGESKSYTIDGKDYEVTLSYVDSTFAKFVVNGETTNKIADGGTFVLSDKTEVGVSDVLYQGYAGGIHSASFFLGASKLELQDTSVATATSSHEMKVGSESIDGADVIISGTDDNTTFSITTIEVNMTAQDNYFVGAGEKLSDVILAAGDEKELLMGNAFEVEYHGLTEEDTHDIMLKKSSARRYELRIFDGDDNAIDLPVAYAEAAWNFTFGKESGTNTNGNREALVISESEQIFKKDYFLLTAGTPSAGSAKSYLLQYSGADDVDKSSPKIKFKNMGSGETLEYSVSNSTTRATIKLGGYSFIVNATSDPGTGDDWQIRVDLGGDGSIGANQINAVDSYGAQFAFVLNTTKYGATSSTGQTEANQTYVMITQSTPNADDYDNQLPTNIVLNMTGVTSDPEMRSTISGYTLLAPDGVTDVTYGYTAMGSFITFNEPSSDPDEFTLNYPKEQMLPQVYFTTGATTSALAGGGTSTPVTVTVDATKLDVEVADVSAQNLIVVGGPCINSVAADLLGSSMDYPACTEGFKPGTARIKMFDNGDNVAMLVAGYTGDETRVAGKVVAQRYSELSGEEVEVEGTSWSSATIGAPTVVEEVMADETTEETTE